MSIMKSGVDTIIRKTKKRIKRKKNVVQKELIKAPKTHYSKSTEDFDAAVAFDFIKHANIVTDRGEFFLVGLSHGQSPAGAYEYILNHYSELKHPDLIKYTFINSKLKKQRGLTGVVDAVSFIRNLLHSERISKDQIIGRSLDRNNLEKYRDGLNQALKAYFDKSHMDGLDYVFLASDPKGLVAGITRNSPAFDSKEYVVLVDDTIEEELTFTPYFLKKSNRIAFLATKSDKRRTLAWLFYKWGKENESPSFLRYVDNIEERVTVFVDGNAMTWPQVVVKRKTPYGDTSIRIDTALPYRNNKKDKRPVILLIHGFLGLNTFDALLAFTPSHKYISAAMHYGTIPHDLPIEDYSQFVVNNINHVVQHFGENGHPVYIFDHSIANTYMMMINEQIEDLDGIKTYLKGRISANPFFGQEAKHASINFFDNVILKARLSFIDRAVFKSTRAMIPMQPKKRARNIGILTSKWMIKSDSAFHARIWKAIKKRIMTLIVDMDSLPSLNRLPIEHTLNRLPIKIFAIQVYSALLESKKMDYVSSMSGYEKYGIEVLILKSSIDPIAVFVNEAYDSSPNVKIVDVTNHAETDIFREHLFYMIHPQKSIQAIDGFIESVRATN